jgi:hypothetical protein
MKEGFFERGRSLEVIAGKATASQQLNEGTTPVAIRSDATASQEQTPTGAPPNER